MARLKVLVSAYACEPGVGSEPAVGWNWVRQIARFHDVWALTRAENRPAIEAADVDGPLARVRWIFFDYPRWTRFWHSDDRQSWVPYYYAWQVGALGVARAWHRRIGFDVVHHATFVNYWVPSLLGLLPAPFVLGPVGGGESAPRSFYASFGPRGIAFELCRDGVRGLARWDPFVRLAASRASVALATTEQTADRLRAVGATDVRVLSQIALPRAMLDAFGPERTPPDRPFRLLSIGKLIHWKGFHLGLRAFARFRQHSPDSEYWIIGDGPERDALAQLAARLGVRRQVRFLGRVPRRRVLESLGECHALMHPSLHDSGGFVCAEAMAAGLPVICLDVGGPAVQVTERTGIAVPARGPEQTVRALAAATRRLSDDPGLRRRMGAAGRRRVDERFRWDRRGEQMNEILQRVHARAAAARTGGGAADEKENRNDTARDDAHAPRTAPSRPDTARDAA